jgi:hypothetical protein
MEGEETHLLVLTGLTRDEFDVGLGQRELAGQETDEFFVGPAFLWKSMQPDFVGAIGEFTGPFRSCSPGNDADGEAELAFSSKPGT